MLCKVVEKNIIFFENTKDTEDCIFNFNLFSYTQVFWFFAFLQHFKRSCHLILKLYSWQDNSTAAWLNVFTSHYPPGWRCLEQCIYMARFTLPCSGRQDVFLLSNRNTQIRSTKLVKLLFKFLLFFFLHGKAACSSSYHRKKIEYIAAIALRKSYRLSLLVFYMARRLL